MNKIILKYAAGMALLLASVAAPTAGARNIPSSELPLIGRGWSSDEVYSVPFARIPHRLVDLFGDNENGRGQSRCSAGLAFHFSTDSRNIKAIYSPWLNHYMPHQAVSGTRGLDLYVYDKPTQSWKYLMTHIPTNDRVQTVDFLLTLTPETRDYLLYLPLYDSVTDFTLVVDDDATVGPASAASLDMSRRVAVYGTSITQGGCASRPGMAGTSILSRRLGCEVLNFAFSAGGSLDAGAARILSQIKDVDVYVIDPVANSSPLTIQQNLLPFMRILLSANPKASFVIVDGLEPNFAPFTPGHGGYIAANERLRQMLDVIRKEYPDRRFEIVPASEFADAEGEASVDGYHFTDVGFMYWARAVAPVVSELLEKH